MDVKIKIDTRELKEAIKRTTRALNNMQPVYRDIGQYMVRSVNKNFIHSGRPKKWEPLKKPRSRGLKKRGRSSNGKPLVDTARLMNSITYEPSNFDVEIGTNVIYGATHQYGRDKIPKRPYLLVQKQDEARIVKIIDNHIGKHLR